MSNQHLLRFVAAALLLLPTVASAAQRNNSLTTTETIKANCQLSKVQDLHFGSYLQANQLNQPAVANDAVGLFNVTCGRDTPYSLTLGTGQNLASGNVRRMRRGGAGSCALAGDCIPYAVYINPARTRMWNVGRVITFTPITAANHLMQHQFYGLFNNSLDYRAGTYTDTVVLTLSY